MKLSKSVRPGHIVSVRGDKFIRCSGKSKPKGVYQMGSESVVLTGDDFSKKVRTIVPSGILVYGAVEVMATNRTVNHLRKIKR